MMVWSVSTAKTFERCQRQWFYKTQLASATASDEARRHAHRLSKLQSVSAWRGNIVDHVLSEQVLPAIQRGWQISVDKALEAALRRFDEQLAIGRQHRLHDANFDPDLLPEGFVAFHDLEYIGHLDEEEIARAREEVTKAIRTFFSMEKLISRLRAADKLITQRSLSFVHGDVHVRAVPDVIVFRGSNPPAIVDWKVHAFGWRDAWLQLAIYASALVRGDPHKDFPCQTTQFREPDIGLLEVQLLTGTLRTHRLSEEHFARADSYMARSSESMLLALGGMNGKAWSLPASDFPVTRYAAACESCPYRSICWETIS
jgi:hypothetical protein